MGGVTRHVWLLFIGSNSYQPTGFVPAWRLRLDEGMLDVRYVRADLPLSRVRFTVAALAGALARSRTYVQEERSSPRVEVLARPSPLPATARSTPPDRPSPSAVGTRSCARTAPTTPSDRRRRGLTATKRDELLVR